MMGSDKWFDMGSVYEPRSVMSYGSTLFAKDTTQPVALLKDGGLIYSGDRISTTDALQAQRLYCADTKNDDGSPMFPDFQYKATSSCTAEDEVGEIRSVFNDRFCDGFPDCPNGEDEDGSIMPCVEKYPRTDKGCCGGLLFNNKECVYSSEKLFFGEGTWDCEDGTGIGFNQLNQWYHLLPFSYPHSGKGTR